MIYAVYAHGVINYVAAGSDSELRNLSATVKAAFPGIELFFSGDRSFSVSQSAEPEVHDWLANSYLGVTMTTCLSQDAALSYSERLRGAKDGMNEVLGIPRSPIDANTSNRGAYFDGLEYGRNQAHAMLSNGAARYVPEMGTAEPGEEPEEGRERDWIDELEDELGD